MHTCSTSTSPPSSVQQVWWRDRLDLQRDGAVQVVESFCSRASPTRSREGEREEGSRAARLEGKVWGWCAPSPLYIEGWAPTLAPPPSLGRRPRREEWGASFPLLLEAPLGFPLGFAGWALWGLVPLAQCGQGTPS